MTGLVDEILRVSEQKDLLKGELTMSSSSSSLTLHQDLHVTIVFAVWRVTGRYIIRRGKVRKGALEERDREGLRWDRGDDPMSEGFKKNGASRSKP